MGWTGGFPTELASDSKRRSAGEAAMKPKTELPEVHTLGAKLEGIDFERELPLSADSGHSRDLDWSAQLDRP
jgi:hypothetical protein